MLKFFYLSHSVFLASAKRQFTPVFLPLSALFSELEMTTSMTGWERLPSSRDLCQVCKAEVHAVVGFSSSSSFGSRTSVQSYKEYLQKLILSISSMTVNIYRLSSSKPGYGRRSLTFQQRNLAHSRHILPLQKQRKVQVSSYLVPRGL